MYVPLNIMIPLSPKKSIIKRKKFVVKNKVFEDKDQKYNKDTSITFIIWYDTIYTFQKKLKLLKIKKNIIIMQNFTLFINFDSNCQIKYTDRTEEYSADGKTTNTFDGYEVSWTFFYSKSISPFITSMKIKESGKENEDNKFK